MAHNVCIGIDLGSCIHHIQFLAVLIGLQKDDMVNCMYTV